MTTSSRVAVVIPAYNAAATISMAIRSALAQPEVAEVVVVDDASSDGTSQAARHAAQGDDRLIVLRQERNIGPAEARNIAVARSTAPFVALLDADDYLMPDRFAPMFAHDGWDIIADNIVFVPESRAPVLPEDLDRPANTDTRIIDTATFLQGNIPDANAYRGEMGFLKPVISRAFLERHGLRYDPQLRLGEDFRIYVEMLLAGARFKVIPCVGYVARVRPDSLSGGHSATDLGNLLAASCELDRQIGQDPAIRPVMKRYLGALRRRYLLHDFLEVKRRSGLARAARHALSPPGNVLPIASGVLRDKLTAFRGQTRQPVPSQRYLFPVR
ncbi:hypothetical protein LCGC14_0497640 [marine sediment metagenome]|uniref:Glycosyltransferase 2-like domain-containing protein n=1 Tax=marine sediment metagenome TaxID=412755 RepID=A0A0F9S9Z7_9ZZZZ